MKNKPKLPVEEVEYLSTLPREQAEARVRALWESGWSLSSIGDSLDPVRPKTTIHFWVKRAGFAPQTRPLPLPPPRPLHSPLLKPSSPRLRPVSPKVPPDMESRLQSLSILARRYRARTPHTSPFAQANEELTAVAKTLRSMGVPTAEIAKAAGVSYRAMARRLSK